MKTDKKINEIILLYNSIIKGIEQIALDDLTRAYGGVIRAAKGSFVEDITKLLIIIAWEELGGKSARISFIKETKKLKIEKKYIDKIENKIIKDHISENINDYHFVIKTDVHCSIDNEFILGVECKAYTENAMLKRIMVDFTFMKKLWPNLNCFLLQLENFMGGDYADLQKTIIYGSKPTHTILSQFDVDLKIITLLEGDRHVERPIHKKEFFKELEVKNLRIAVDEFKKVLKKYL